jgi:hypothetical protein
MKIELCEICDDFPWEVEANGYKICLECWAEGAQWDVELDQEIGAKNVTD